LLSYANEGRIKSLDTVKPLQGDTSLMNACRQAMQFTKQTADEGAPER